MLIVIALGGNALLKRGEPLTIENQRANTKIAAKSIAEVIAAGHKVIITHGNGPQVGLLALQSYAYKPDEAYPLDVLGAESEGMIGYLIEQELENILPSNKEVAILLTQVEVDLKDPAFVNPTKPIGPIYSKEEADILAKKHGWTVSADGENYRRVVASPTPMHISNIPVIKILLEHNIIVVCTGGGGIPIVRQENGLVVGVEAVIDKDLASSVLAANIGADVFFIITDVPKVYVNYKKKDQKALNKIKVKVAQKYLDNGEFGAGSMGPKISAAIKFATITGNESVITDAESLPVKGCGTRITI